MLKEIKQFSIPITNMQFSKTAYLFLVLTVTQFDAFTQDSLKRIKFSISADIWMQKNHEATSVVSMPSAIKNIRQNATTLPTSFDSLTDNPLFHGATYVAIRSASTFKNKFTLNFDLYAEQRGSSYGLFNKNNTLLFPVFNIQGKDTFNFSKTSLTLDGKAGMFLNEKLDEGLTIYNIDVQGVKLTFQQGKWLTEATVYADLNQGIGLNIDDLYSVALKRKLSSNDSAEVGISFTYNKQLNRNTPLRSNLLYNVFAHKKNLNSKIYSQLGFRPGNDFDFRVSNSIAEKIAGLLGVECNYLKNGVEFNAIAEARYYGAIYNEGYFDFKLRYRNPANSIFEMYANTVGNYLYPLRKLQTPFSQWAVFTEYYYSNTFSLNVRGNLNIDVRKKITAGLMYDINFIRAKDNFNGLDNFHTSSFLYPFFTASINYKLIKEVNISLLLTNQSMNLDLSYPTCYLLTHPRFGFRLEGWF